MRDRGFVLLQAIIFTAILFTISVFIYFQYFRVSSASKVNQKNSTRKITTPTPATIPTEVPSTPTEYITRNYWRPSVNLFTIQVPAEWEVKQIDGGHSVDVFTSPKQNGLGVYGGNLEITIGTSLGRYPQDTPQLDTTIGNKNARRTTKDNINYILVEDVYSNTKDTEFTIIISYSNNDPEIVMVDDMLKGIMFEPSVEQIDNSRIIP